MPIPSSPRQLTPHSPHGSDTATVTAQSPDTANQHFTGQRLSIPTSHAVSYSSADGLLSPHPQSPPARRPVKRSPVPAPAPLPLDLPTRADVQAAEAVASAESRGLRGGWVMSMEALPGQHQQQSSAASSRRSTVSTLADDIGLISMSRDKGKKPMRGGDEELVNGGSRAVVEMENIDLERGRNERFGSQPGPSRSSVERTSMDGPHIGMDSRRTSQIGFPGGLQIRTPSPLSMVRANDATPRPTVSARNSAFFSDNPFEGTEDDHVATPVAPKAAHASPAVPVKAMEEVEIKVQHDDDVEAGMQDIKI